MDDFLCMLLLVLGIAEGIQDQTYVFTFLENDRELNKDLGLYISSTSEDRETIGNIFIPHRDLTIPFTVGLMNGTLIHLPLGAEPSGASFEDSTLFIQADQHVYVYGYSFDERSSDSFYAMPAAALGTEYYVVTPSGRYSSSSYPTFSITAVYDNTSVLIYFNQPYNDHNSTNPMPLTLSSLSTYVLKIDFDFTGTRISSSRPISVSSGHECSSDGGDCDHSIEVFPPVDSWGKTFVMTSFIDRVRGYYIKILARDIGTVVRLLPQDEDYEIPISGTIDIDISSVVIMESNHPILVVALMKSDPFMSVIPAIEQSIPGPLPFYCFSSDNNHLNLWTSSRDYHGVLLDNEQVNWEVLLNSESSGSLLRTDVSAGRHVVRHIDPSVIFNGIVYGYDYYSAHGHTLPYKSAVLDVVDTTAPSITICHTSPVEVIGNHDSNVTSVDWMEPSATDENGLPLIVSSNRLPGDSLTIGTTTVTYSFTDNSGNQALCSFDVIVHDNTPPVPTCPRYIRIDSCSTRAKVAWPEPSVWDNSEGGITITTTDDIEPGDVFRDSVVVQYTFTDTSGNSASCIIKIELNYKDNMCWDLNMPFIISTVILGLTLLPLIFTLSISLYRGRRQANKPPHDQGKIGEINMAAFSPEEDDEAIYEETGHQQHGETNKDYGKAYEEPKNSSGIDFGTAYEEPKASSGIDFGTAYEEPKASPGIDFGTEYEEPHYTSSGIDFGTEYKEPN